MDNSDGSDDGFARQPGGEALVMGEDDDHFDDSEEQLSDQEQNHPPLAKPKADQAKVNIKADAIQNQHHDLAVDVNDSEEIDSEEEEDEVQMDQQQ